jgi:uncharacterized protein (DUF4415 family)
MRKSYDFSRGQKNPYARKLKKQVTIRLDDAVLAYFKQLGAKTEMPWQTLVNLYLRECASSRKELRFEWRPAKP